MSLVVCDGGPHIHGPDLGGIMSIALQAALLSITSLTMLILALGWINLLFERSVASHEHDVQRTSLPETTDVSGVRPALDVGEVHAAAKKRRNAA